MTLKFMNKLGVKFIRPYQNAHDLDYKEMRMDFFIKDLHVILVVYSDIDILMEVVIMDVLDAQGI